MPIELAQLSIVVTANVHNPSILHPSFLKAEGVVPADWETKGAVISTPAVSSVTYANGISFTVEPGKLQVIETGPPTPPSGSMIPTLVKRYLELLPKVNYSALGLNFATFVERSDGPRYVGERFVAAGWQRPPFDHPVASELRLMYERLGAQLRLSVAPGGINAPKALGRADARRGIVVSGNYNWRVKGLADAVAALQMFSAASDDFILATGVLLPDDHWPLRGV